MTRLGVTVLAAILCWAVRPSGAQFCDGFSCPHTVRQECTIPDIRSALCLKKAMESLNCSGKKSITLKDIAMKDGLPPRAFDQTQFDSLFFKHSKIGKLSNSSESPFLGQNRIKKLYFLRTQDHLRNWNFSHLAVVQLTELTFSGAVDKAFHLNNYLPAKFNQSGTEHVKRLQVLSCCLRRIMAWSLSSFVNVETIELYGNSIENIESNAFPANARYLKTIDLRGNCIRRVGQQMFTVPHLPELQVVYLQMNSLETIDEGAIPDVEAGVPKKIRKFYINDNHKLNCEDMEWLVKMDASLWQDKDGPAATCALPYYFKGCPLASLTQEHFDDAQPPPGTCNPDLEPNDRASCPRMGLYLGPLRHVLPDQEDPRHS